MQIVLNRGTQQDTMGDRRSEPQLEEDICIHIFTVSAAMVGVCLTAIGLIGVVVTMREVSTVVDDLLAGDALLFLLACLLSYWALRTRSIRRLHTLEHIADALFVIGLTLMAAVCALITYAIGLV